MRKVLYLGLNPPSDVIHYPVIRTERIIDSEKEALSLWSQFSHVLFTSKTAVRYWFEIKEVFNKRAIAIGHATGKELQKRGVEPIIVPEATQEGVIEWLEEEPIAFLFYPRSKRARPLLLNHLQQKKIPHLVIDLYDTHFQKLEPIPNLDSIDEIVFTSPSTVDGFIEIFGKIPSDKILTSMGHVTARRLKDQT